jgi:hypothetical protein
MRSFCNCTHRARPSRNARPGRLRPNGGPAITDAEVRGFIVASSKAPSLVLRLMLRVIFGSRLVFEKAQHKEC